VREEIPQARIVADRFHVARHYRNRNVSMI